METRRGLTIRPLTLTGAFPFIAAHHAHLSRPQEGGLFAVGVELADKLVCVAILGRPTARLAAAQTPTAHVAEVTLVASDGTVEHAASKALAAITRAALTLGWTRIISYTLLGEAGTIYRACGWHPTAISAGGEFGTAKRPRRKTEQPGKKVRWETGPAALPVNVRVDRAVREAVGMVRLNPSERTVMPAMKGTA